MVVYLRILIFFFKQKTAYEMRISDWSSDVCSSDLLCPDLVGRTGQLRVSLGSFLAAFRNQFGAVGRIGINQLLLLRHLRLVAGDELFLLQLRTDAIGDLGDSLGLPGASETIP